MQSSPDNKSPDNQDPGHENSGAITGTRLVQLGFQGAAENMRVLVLMALGAGVLTALITGPTIALLPPELLNVGGNSEAEAEAAFKEAVPFFWRLLVVHGLALLATSALTVPWARMTSAFDLTPLGKSRNETVVRIVRVFWRQVSIFFYWFFLFFLSMSIASLIIPLLPGILGELLFFLIALFLGLMIFVLASFMHTIIIAESCFGKLSVPAMIKATRLMVGPLSTSLFMIGVVSLLALVFASAIMAAIIPEAFAQTAQLILSGATSFLITALHIAGINKLPIWMKATMVESGEKQ